MGQSDTRRPSEVTSESAVCLWRGRKHSREDARRAGSGRKAGLRAELSGKKERKEERRGNPLELELRASLHCSEQLRGGGDGGTGGVGDVCAVRSLEWVGCNSLRTSDHQRKNVSITHRVEVLLRNSVAGSAGIPKCARKQSSKLLLSTRRWNSLCPNFKTFRISP